MFDIFDKLTDFLKDTVIESIQANLQTMFTDINVKVGSLAGEVSQTPSGWNPEVFSFIKNINDNVIVPIAGLVITAVLCIELIHMVMEKNNMRDGDTFEFFKYMIKMWVAVFLVSHAFQFSMAAFDVGQYLVNKAAGVVSSSSSLSNDQILAMVAGLKAENLGALFVILVETMLVKLSLQIISIIIMLVVYGRMFEMYVYSSVSSLPFATLGNKEWGSIGTNYIKGLFALGLQGLFIMVCLGIYTVLIRNVVMSDIHTGLWGVLGYSVLLGLMLFKTGSISKSILNTH